jgi:hypothetical protein
MLVSARLVPSWPMTQVQVLTDKLHMRVVVFLAGTVLLSFTGFIALTSTSGHDSLILVCFCHHFRQ